MAPKTPDEAKWNPDALREGSKAIFNTARSIEVLTESGELSWRDPSVKQTSSGGAVVLFRPIDAPASYEEFISQGAAQALHETMLVLTMALKNLAKQARYGSDGLNRMADKEEGVEDANLAAAYGVITKALDPDGEGS